MIIQVLDDYGNRTEYKVLEKFASIYKASINDLNDGTLLVPGILLGKLRREDIIILNKWLNTYNNQLILSSAWKEVNLKDFFDLSVDLKVVKSDALDYEGIECLYRVEGKVQEKIFTNQKGDFGVSCRRDTGSGLITVFTLPLLDYKLSHKHDEFQQYFNACINKVKSKESRQDEGKEIFDIRETDLHLFLLLAAGLKTEEELTEGFSKYFNKSFNLNEIQTSKEVLAHHDIIESGEITDKGKKLVKEKGLKPFIKVLEGRGETDGW